jgi:hypothetical protein
MRWSYDWVQIDEMPQLELSTRTPPNVKALPDDATLDIMGEAHHIKIQSQCGACGFPFLTGDRLLALCGTF